MVYSYMQSIGHYLQFRNISNYDMQNYNLHMYAIDVYD